MSDPAAQKYMKATQDAMEALKARMNPGFNFGKLGQALLTPTRGGSFGESLGNAAGVIGDEQLRQEQEAIPIAQMRAQLAGQEFQMGQRAKAMQGLQSMTGGAPQVIAAADLPMIAKTLNLAEDDPKLTQLVGQPKAPFMIGSGQSVIGVTAQPSFSKEEVNQALIASNGDPSAAMKMLFDRYTKINEPGAMQKDIAYAMNPNTPPLARNLALQKITMDAQKLNLDIARLFVESGYVYPGTAPPKSGGDPNFSSGPARPQAGSEGTAQPPAGNGMMGTPPVRKEGEDQDFHGTNQNTSVTGASSSPASGWTMSKDGKIYVAPDGVPLDLSEIKSPKIQQELLADAQKRYAERSSVGFTKKSEAQAEADVKEITTLRTLAKTASNVVTLADNQLSLIKNNPVVFGYLNDSSASSAILRAIKSASVANANLAPDEIARYLKGSVKEQDLDTVAMFINNATQLNLNFARIAYANQGAVTENERSYINTLAGSPSESPTVLRLKAQAYRTSAQRDMDIHQAYLDFEKANPRGNYNDFLRSNSFKQIKTTYEQLFTDFRKNSEQLLRAKPAAPATGGGGKNTDRLRVITGG